MRHCLKIRYHVFFLSSTVGHVRINPTPESMCGSILTEIKWGSLCLACIYMKYKKKIPMGQTVSGSDKPPNVIFRVELPCRRARKRSIVGVGCIARVLAQVGGRTRQRVSRLCIDRGEVVGADTMFDNVAHASRQTHVWTLTMKTTSCHVQANGCANRLAARGSGNDVRREA